MTESSCVICIQKKDLDSDFYDEAICKDCIDSNKEVLDFTKNPERFKKELNSLFYASTWEHWYAHEKELEFIMKRWGIWKND